MLRLLSRTTNLVVVITGILVFWLSQRDFLTDSPTWKTANWALIDLRYSWRGELPADTNIVMVGVEESSMVLNSNPSQEIQASPTLQLMRKPFPWDREVWAATLQKLMDAGAKVVALDFVFGSDVEGDDSFAKVISKYRDHVVLASMFQEGKDQNGDNHNTYVAPNPLLLPPGTKNVIGLASVWPDEDAVVRRGRYRASSERLAPGLEKFAGIENPDDLIVLSALAVQKFAGRVDTPPFDHDNFIDFRGGAGIYHPVPLEDLFIDKIWNSPPINGGTIFSNKIVIVGPFAEILGHDIHRTPFGEMPGPIVQAQMVATLLNHSSLTELSPKLDGWLTFGMVCMALAICLGVQNAMLKPVLLIITTGGFVGACQYGFAHDGFVVGMMSPLFGFVGTAFFGVLFQFVFEQFERRRYRSYLDRYVSKGVARLILDDTRSFADSLNGRKQSGTVLFSDIRGFTSLTESSDPEQLVKQLNEYFREMVGAVLKENGTLQKFIGDAIMAAWGDVHTEGAEEDARRAVRTALDMRAALTKLNAKWAKQPNRTPLHTGIGVNTGEMIVGNIGHPQRMEFTVLGDVVNQAARFESATKQFHADLLVGESVEALTRNHFVFRRVGLLTVKGKTKPVETFNVLSERSQPEPPWLARYHEAIRLFRARRFDEAGKLFQAVAAEIGASDFLCEMYVTWCALFAKEPPPPDWNGTFVLTEK